MFESIREEYKILLNEIDNNIEVSKKDGHDFVEYILADGHHFYINSLLYNYQKKGYSVNHEDDIITIAWGNDKK